MISSTFWPGKLWELQALRTAPGLDVEVRNGTSEVLHEVSDRNGEVSVAPFFSKGQLRRGKAPPNMGFNMV